MKKKAQDRMVWWGTQVAYVPRGNNGKEEEEE